MRKISAIFSFIYKERNKEKKKDVVVINVAWNDNDNVPAFRLVLATVPVERLSGTLESRFALETRRVCRENSSCLFIKCGATAGQTPRVLPVKPWHSLFVALSLVRFL